MADFWRNHQRVLSRQETEKSKKFRFSEDRMRYVAGKITTRLLLQRYLGVDEIIFFTHELGKPYHKEIAGKPVIDFNISHSGGVVLAVFSCGMDVGADVQEMTQCPDYIDIARNFFTAEESRDVEGNDGYRIFFRYWAAKEAYLKATGAGLSRGMDFFSVRDRKITENGSEKRGWWLIPVDIKGYAAYAAAHRRNRQNGIQEGTKRL